MNAIEIGKRIRELRLERKLSQNQMVDLLSVSQDTISFWENGKSLPSAEYLIEISKNFNVSTDYILGLTDY